jgi:CheY-like chemotaxis protein
MATKILAIDDSPTLRQFITRSLKQHTAGYDVITAHDGEQGLELASSEAPELILLDYVLPGMKGDDVCRNLAKSENTRGIPVVLMSSSSTDIQRTAAECSNVVKSISKPFTPELLCATVGGVVRALNEESARKSAESAPAVSQPAVALEEARPAEKCIAFCGHTGGFSLHSALLAIEQDALTGILRVFTTDEPAHLYVKRGRPLVVGTRDVRSYMGGSLALVPQSSQDKQTATGCPVHLIMAGQGALDLDEARKRCRAADARMLAPAWTRLHTAFEFDALNVLPSWLSEVLPFTGPITEWALESLREVGEESNSAHAWGEGTGVPAYTRRGYERIQHVPLNDEELALASLVDSRRSIADIAMSMNVPREKAERILFRFMCLEIFDHWPASILRQA